MKNKNIKADKIFVRGVIKLYKLGYSSREIARSFKRSHTKIAEIIKENLQQINRKF